MCGGCAWQGGMRGGGGGHVWQGVCMAEGACVVGHAPLADTTATVYGQ